jgi:hypothetical protein
MPTGKYRGSPACSTICAPLTGSTLTIDAFPSLSNVVA